MKSEKRILVAFLLNLFFSIFEFVGGIFTRSVAIMSDAVHDIGDAMSIGISYFLEKKSKKQPDEVYTYGYARFSVMGGVITTAILLIGSAAVIYNAVLRLFNPVQINYNGMIIFAIVGVVVNFVAAVRSCLFSRFITYPPVPAYFGAPTYPMVCSSPALSAHSIHPSGSFPSCLSLRCRSRNHDRKASRTH